MSNYYSTSLSLILQNAGENSTTWGSFVNTNFQTLLEQAIVGQTTITMANADYTLTSSQGVSNEARNAVLIITGNQNATYNVIVPAVPKLYIITNNLSSSATAYLKVTGSSTSFSIANGNTMIVYCTGSNTGTAFYAVNYVANAGNLLGTPNISVGTIASGAQTVTGASGNIATVVASGVSVTNTVTGVGTVTAVHSGYALNASSGFIIYTNNTAQSFSFGSSGITSIAAGTTISAPTLTSTVATGTAPFTVTSTTPVTNLSIGGNAATATTSTNATNVVTGGTIASNVTATTQTAGDNSTKIATTAYVATAVSNATPSNPAFSAYMSALQIISPSGYTKLQFDTKTFDTNSNYNTTNYRFTPTVGGYYQINYIGTAEDTASGGTNVGGALYKNGSLYVNSFQFDSFGQRQNVSFSTVVYLNGSSDYVEIYGYTSSGSGTNFAGGSNFSCFSGVWIRS